MRRLLRLLVIVLLASGKVSATNLHDIRVQRLSGDNGLPSSTVFQIQQDSMGFLWVGTETGLYRYDGYTPTIFSHTPRDPASLSANIMRGIVAGSGGKMWIGTYGGGLDLYEPGKEGFKHFRHDDSDPSSLSANQIWTLSKADNGRIWVGTMRGGLDLFDPATGKFKHFRHEDSLPGSLASNRVNTVFRDESGQFWVGTNNGLDRFLPKTETFEHHLSSNAKSPESHARQIWAMAESKGGTLWVGTNNGILKSTNNGQSFVAVDLKTRSGKPLGDGLVRALLVDREGNLWIGFWGEGVAVLPPDSETATVLGHTPWDSRSLNGDSVWSLFQDHDGLIWIGTSAGLSSYNPSSRAFHLLGARPDDPTALASSNVTAVSCRDTGTVWAATDGFIQQVNLDNGTVSRRIPLAKLRGQGPHVPYTAMFVHEGRILIGTGTGQLANIDIATGNVLDQQQLSQRHRGISTIISDRADGYWISTFGDGVFHLTAAGLIDRHFQHVKGDEDSIHDDKVTPIMLLPTGRIAAGTESGLEIIDRSTGRSQRVPLPLKSEPFPAVYSLGRSGIDSDQMVIGTAAGLFTMSVTHNDKLATHNFPATADTLMSIFNIQPQTESIFWAASDDGLYRVQTTSGKLTKFASPQGVPNLNFNMRAHCSDSKTGTLIFGTTEGLLYFNPNEISYRNTSPLVAVTSFMVQGKSSEESLKQARSGLLTLPYERDNIGIRFSLLNFFSHGFNTYRYRLGTTADSEWQNLGSRNDLTFTRLSPGTYHLEISGTDPFGHSPREPAHLNFRILPPPWATWWAYVIYTILAFGLLFAYFWRQRNKLQREREINLRLREADRLKSQFVEELQDQVEKATEELRLSLEAMRIKNVELDVAHKRAQDFGRVKSEFLADMSHEIRTPLNGLLGYLRLLHEADLKPEQKTYLRTARQSAETLLAIVNDVLDYSKLEAGKLLLEESTVNLREWLAETLELLAPVAYSKDLVLACIVDEQLPEFVETDAVRLRQILVNLVANAIKFTPHGSVTIRAEQVQRNGSTMQLRLSISDTGIGISEEQRGRLFQAFTQAETSTDREYGGTGLGLVIVKRILDLMGGELKLESSPGVGSTFTIELELGVPAATNEISLKGELDGWQVAVYDEHPLFQQSLVSTLRFLGCHVERLRDRRDLLALLERAPTCDAVIVGLSHEEAPHTATITEAIARRHARQMVLAVAPTLELRQLAALSERLHTRCRPKCIDPAALIDELRTLAPVGGNGTIEPHSMSGTMTTEGPLGGERLLVVDDNAVNRHLLATLARQNGALVTEAASAETLFARIAEQTFDAILLDVHMPGMSGVDAAARIRSGQSESRNVPIVAVSADALEKTRRAALEAGMDAYLLKPVEEDDLVEVVRRSIRHRRKDSG
ncbi:MAG: ATP-binding protein [Gammaproteobacteria bacterium]|jgi:signal transduction histidine kinase/ligand-binding sensor domain-containing protein/CheY-like chemotaxis protein